MSAERTRYIVWLAEDLELIYTINSIIIRHLAGCRTVGARRERLFFATLRMIGRPLWRATTSGWFKSIGAVRMLDALCRRASEVPSARKVAERCMVLLVFVGNSADIWTKERIG